jgi:hypothetical protein
MLTPSRRRHASTPRRQAQGLDRRLPGRVGTFGAVPADEIDGDEVAIVSEYDPFG